LYLTIFCTHIDYIGYCTTVTTIISTSATARRKRRRLPADYATSDMPKPNIVIIVLDTLREDHDQDLDKLLDYGFVKYQNAIAPAS
jgi:hypothetical protein